MGGHLVTITSPEENDFVVRLLADPRYWHPAPDTGLMVGPLIGAQQSEGAREPDGSWRWVTEEPFLYSNWKNGEPNDGTSPFQMQQCIQYFTEGDDWLNSQWGDTRGGRPSTRSFIVESRAEESRQAPVPSAEYASMVLGSYNSDDQSVGPDDVSAISVLVESESQRFVRRFARKRRTMFAAPGKYDWKILDGTKGNRQLGHGSITVRNGQRVEFRPDGRVLVLPAPISDGNTTASEADLNQWRVSEGGNGNWYRVAVATRPITWDEAERRAEAMGGHLVTITSRAQEDFVLGLINDDLFWSVPEVFGPWIGCAQLDEAREPDGGWRWVTGEPFLYSNWASGQPNDNARSVTHQERARYVASRSDWLGAQWCDGALEQKAFIIEWDGRPLPARSLLSKEDPYGVLVVQIAASEPESMDIVFFVKNAFHQRRAFGKTHSTLFVVPGTYVCQWWTSGKEQEVRRESVEVKAGERIVFTPEGWNRDRPHVVADAVP